MPTEFLGLPLHPLSVHLPVVFVPLLALFTIGYVVLPRFRRNIGWWVVALTVITPVVSFVARWSGQVLVKQKLEELREAPEAAQALADSVNNHSQYGDVLVWLVLAIAPLAWLFAGLTSRRLDAFAKSRSMNGLSAWLGSEDEPKQSRKVVLIVLGVLLVGLSVASLWYVFKAGHTGAEMIWG